MRKADDDYDWAADAIASYNLAIETLRERYLEDRLPGESAKEWLERTGQQRLVNSLCRALLPGANKK